MVDLAFFNTEERTEYSDELYAVIGRALAVATHYEANCKALVSMLEIKKQPALLKGKQEEVEEKLKKLWKRTFFKNIQVLTSFPKETAENQKDDPETARAKDFADYLLKILDKAREARNDIAHEITLGIEDKAEYEEYRGTTIEMIQEQVKYIAEADFHIAGFIENFNKTNIATSLDKYIERIMNWVCETGY